MQVEREDITLKVSMQARGIVKLHGATLKFLEVFDRGIRSPEGIVFANNSAYVVRYATSCPIRR